MAKVLSIDSLGRVVLPKALRERYGLGGGAELDLTDTGDGILLTPRRAPTALRRLKNGFPVLAVAGQTKVDLIEAIDRVRDERDARNQSGADAGDDSDEA